MACILALNIAAMLIAFLALIALAERHSGRHSHSSRIAWFPSSLEADLRQVVCADGLGDRNSWRDCAAIGNLLGTRMVLNELVAFSMLGPQRAVLDPRSFTIATFALCGFANFSSIGIQMGGIGALAPKQARRTGEPRNSRHARGHDGEPDVSFNRGNASLDLSLGRN